ncbi:MAG: tetratricopeptide repeat protein [Woeseiaceae bacterium]|nr:tetratricopeptide repeat protein [Woeseiaceae bacterium]
MMAAANTLVRVCAIALLAATAAITESGAQQTLQIESGAELRELLRRAETLLAENRSQAAYDLLQPLETRGAGDAYFDYLLGVAALDSGRTAEAILSLRRAVSSAPQFSGARMELARAHFEAGDDALARTLFVTLLGENPPSGVRDVIDQYIAAIDARPAAPPSRFDPYAELTLGHDSNANGSTDDQQFLGFTLNPENLETDSSFYEAGLGFSWTTPRSAGFAWDLGAHLGYRGNPDAEFVDAGILSGRGGMLWRSGAVFGRAYLNAYAATRDGDSNESYGGIDFTVGRDLSDRWDLSFSLTAGALRYADEIEILDVDRILYSVGANYRWHSRGRVSLEAIGGGDSEQQSGSPYGNSKFGGRLSVNTAIGDSTFLFASLGSLTSDYDGLFFGASREDTQLTSVLQFEFRDVWTDGLTIAPRVRYIHNDSDVALYDYDRTEVGVLLRWMPR